MFELINEPHVPPFLVEIYRLNALHRVKRTNRSVWHNTIACWARADAQGLSEIANSSRT